MHVPSLVKLPWHLLKLSPRNENMGVSWTDNSVKIWRNSPISNPKPDLHNINAHTKFGENPLMFNHPETKIWACLGQITPSKFDEICPLAIPNQISIITMHIPCLVKIHWGLLKLSSGNEIQRMDGRMYVRRTDGHPTWNHNTLPLLCGGV